MRKHRTSVRLSSLTYEEAKKLQRILETYFLPEDFEYLFTDLREGLAPFYVYEVKCTECPRTYNVESSTRIPKSRLEKGGVCSNCMDNFK